MKDRKKVLIIYKFLPQYRVAFFELLKKKLLDHNIDLDLVYGQSNKTDALKNDEAKIEWAKPVQNKFIKFRGKNFIWQPCMRDLRGKDLVITLSENKLLINYYLMASRFFSSYKYACWGHVYNMQNDINSFDNKVKLFFANSCDWWFAYTTGARNFLVKRKYPANQITVVQNAIETSQLKARYENINDEQVNELKQELGIDSENVAIYCGSLYPEKDFDFILETCYITRKAIPDFHMIFVGAGIEAAKIKEAAEKHPWIHYVGPKFGEDRAIYFKISKVQLMPRLIGLAIVDSFVLETPTITTEHPFHGPEIDYLENGINGIKTADSMDEYSTAVIKVFKTEQYKDLLPGCRVAAEKYTVEHMAENFTQGVLKCLAAS
jgi:glycosyltransferase involved in cell wall biosynthesis